MSYANWIFQASKGSLLSLELSRISKDCDTIVSTHTPNHIRISKIVIRGLVISPHPQNLLYQFFCRSLPDMIITCFLLPDNPWIFLFVYTECIFRFCRTKLLLFFPLLPDDSWIFVFLFVCMYRVYLWIL